MLAERKCAYCNNPFQPTRRDNKYCSQKCGQKAFHKKRESLGATDIEAEPTMSALPASKELVPPTQLDVVAQFIVKSLETQRDELKDTVKTQSTKIEDLTEKNRGLEKDVERLTRELNEKPTGLSGVIQNNPNAIKEALQELPGVFGGIRDLIKEWKGNQAATQIGATPSGDSVATPLLQWLGSLPEQPRNEIIQMLVNLSDIKDLKMLSDMVAYINRSMMAGKSRQM